MDRVTTKIGYIILLAVFMLGASAAQAALMHPDVMGTEVWFRGIEESSPTGDPLPLYGTPSVAGNTLDFPTTGNFSAMSIDGTGSDQTDGKLNLMVKAKQGFSLTKLSLSETGLTELDAPFGGDAFSRVNAFVVLNIVEVAGLPVNIPVITEFFSFLPSNQFLHSVDATGPSFSSAWTGSAMIDLPPDVTKVNITLDNNLFSTTTGAGTRSFIDKKDFQIDVDTEELIRNDIPEPSVFALAFCGLLGMTLTGYFPLEHKKQ